MNAETVISRTCRWAVPFLLCLFIAVFYYPIKCGLYYLSYDNFIKDSMYGRTLGLSAYLLYLLIYPISSYYLIINIVFRDRAIRISDGTLYHYWKRIAKIDEIDFAKVEYRSKPISIILFMKNGETKSMNVSMCEGSREEIFERIKKLR